MKSIEKLRWDDVYTQEQEEELVAAVQLAISKLLATCEAQTLVQPLVLADLGGWDDVYYVTEQLIVDVDGTLKRKYTGLFGTKKRRIKPTRETLKRYKVSVKDVRTAAEKLGVQL